MNNTEYFFSVLFGNLPSFAEYDSEYKIGSAVLTVLMSIIAAFIYDIIKKRNTRAAEEFVYNSLCEFVKRGKIPNGNLMETLINEAARKYRLGIGDLPAPEVFVERAQVNLLTDSLYTGEEMHELLDLLEHIKNRCRRSCIINFWLKVKNWVEFGVFITIVFILVFVLFITFGYINFYDIASLHLLLLLFLIVLLLLYRVILCSSNPRKKKLCCNEIKSAWKRFIMNWELWCIATFVVVELGVLVYDSRYDMGMLWIIFWILIGFLISFCITLYFSNFREENLLHNEIVNAWKRYIKEGNEEAKNEHWQSASICYYKAMESYPASEIEEYDYVELFILQGKALTNLGVERFNDALDSLGKGLEHLKDIRKRKENQGISHTKLDRDQEIELEGEAYCYMACLQAKIESKKDFQKVLTDKIKKLDNSILESVMNELVSWLQKNLKNPEEYIELVEQSKKQEDNCS